MKKTFLLLALMGMVSCRQKDPSDELVTQAVKRDIFDSALEKNGFLKDFYHVDSIEKKSEQDSDLTAESHGVLKGVGRTIHSRVVLTLLKDCNSSRYHERYSIPACDMGSGPESSVENKGIPQHKRGQTFTIENIDLKFTKMNEPSNSPWQIF